MHAVRFNQNDERLVYKPGSEEGAPSAEMRMDTGSSGGFMVPEQFRSELLRIEPQTSLVRPRANVIPAGSPPDAAITIPALDQSGPNPSNMFGGVEVQWIAEGQTKPETDAKLKEVRLEPKEVAGHVVVTDKLLRNWQAAGSFIESLLRGAITQAEDFAFITGAGVGKPLGFLNAPATVGINRLGANAIQYRDIVAMVSRLLMRGGSPAWAASQSVIPQLMTLKDDEGKFIFTMNAGEGLGARLAGYPIIWNNRLPTLGERGDLTLTDLSHYLIKDGSGPFVAASEHVHFKENKTVIKVFWNVDGQPWLSAPFTEENGWEVSPFIALDDPA